MRTPFQRRQQRLTATLGVALAFSAIAASTAAADIAPQLRSPRTATTLAAGTEPTFKVIDAGQPHQGHVWLKISTSKKRDRFGGLKRTDVGTFTKMKRVRRNLYTYQPPDYSFPTWFMNRPGKYYWQAFHINCAIPDAQRTACNVYSPIYSFFVS